MIVKVSEAGIKTNVKCNFYISKTAVTRFIMCQLSCTVIVMATHSVFYLTTLEGSVRTVRMLLSVPK